MIDIQIGLDGVPSQKNILLGNKYENKDEFIHFELPSEFDTYNKYVLGVITTETEPNHTVVLPVTNNIMAVSTGLTYYAGKWELHLMCREHELNLEKDTVDIAPQDDEHVFISDAFIGVVNRNKIDASNIQNQPLDSNLQFIYDDLLALINKVNKALEDGDFDGMSPTLSYEATENGYKINLTDKTGTKSFELLNGQPGKDGTSYEESEEFQSLATQIHADSISANDSANRASQSQTTISGMIENINQALEEMKAIYEDVRSLPDEISSFKTEMTSTKSAIETIKTNIDSAEDRIVAIEGGISSAKETVESYKNAAETAKTNAEKAKKSVDTTKSTIDEIKTQIDSISTEVASNASQASQSATQADTAKTQALSAQSAVEQAKTEAVGASESATQAKDQAVAAQTAAEQAKTSAETAKANAESAAQTATQKANEITSSLAEIQATLASIEERLTALETPTA